MTFTLKIIAICAYMCIYTQFIHYVTLYKRVCNFHQ